MKKDFGLDDERLKELGGEGYFKELLERSGIFEHLKKYFIDRYLKYMLQVLIIIQQLKLFIIE